MLKKELKIIGISILAGVCLSLLFAARMVAYADKTQQDIADNVIRFHVKANSDAFFDQDLKNAVRDRVLTRFRDGLSAANSVEETRRFINENIEEIIDCARQVVHEWGYDYPVTAGMTESYFPTRVYGDIVFPPGEYEALRIVIGEGNGNNWWCLLFPPLCYVDVTHSVPENEKDRLMYLLPEEGYKLLTYTSRDDSVKVRFKIVEWWQHRKEHPDRVSDRMASQ
jgi:stage II sporulation protein R